MPDEPKKPEELLQAYAEQRRQEQGEPAPLAAFRRQQLQDEVARTYGTGAAGTKATPGWWTWPRLAWLGVACAVTVVAVLNFNPAREQQLALKTPAEAPAKSELADNILPLEVDSLVFKEAAPQPTVAEPAVRLANAPPMLEDAAGKSKADSFSRAEKDSAVPPPPASAAARSVELLNRDMQRSPAGDAVKLSTTLETRQQAAAVNEAKRMDDLALGREGAETETLAGARNVLLKPASVNEPATTGGVAGARLFLSQNTLDTLATAQQAATSQRYVQVDNRAQYRRNFNSPPPLPVMNQFSWQQNGQQVVIVDADGSQYTGLITNAPALGQTVTGLAATPNAEMVQRYGLAAASPATVAGRALDGAAGDNIWYFRVSGTNRSLNQSVVFEGNLQNVVTTFGTAAAPRQTQPETATAGEPVPAAALPISTTLPAATSNTYNFQNQPAHSNTYQNFYQNAYQNSQIRGRVTVGGSNQVEINALPAQP